MRTLIFLLLGASLTARAHPVDCGRSLAPERGRIAAALAFALGESGPLVDGEPLAHLDRDLENWVTGELAALSPARRENFLRVIEESRLGTRLDPEPEDEEALMDETAAQLVASDKNLVLVLEAFETQSEGARFALRHELGHLLRFVVDGDLAACGRNAEAMVLRRPLGMLREEAHAARGDYRYLRRNYGAADVERLRSRVLELPAMIEVARGRGILIDDGHGALEVDRDRLEILEHKMLFVAIMRIEADARLLAYLREALASTEAAYVKSHVARYRDSQAEIDRSR